ncbi:MAG TPA: nucleotidyltransferase family protein, partial [Candidatus Polarisedimenticolia bacterium]|nr:nucleotidyltransferase family protein [Candidatus Polarisedimenticolia bacterium]
MLAPARPSIRHQNALLTALRGGTPFGVEEAATAAALLRRYECGGFIQARRIRTGAAPLPEPWRSAVAAAHQKTLVDSLAAIGVGREVLTLLAAAGIPVVALKGAAYLATLYTDPGERALTDVDLLIPPRDTQRAAALLAGAGFEVLETIDSPDVAEHRRFEMARPGPAPCRVELHWAVGSGARMRFDQEGLWSRAQPASIQGAACRTLEPHDALLYHVGHAREHYFGPTLKWALDL